MIEFAHRFVLRGTGFGFREALLPGRAAARLADQLTALEIEADGLAPLLIEELGALTLDRPSRRRLIRAIHRGSPVDCGQCTLAFAWNTLAAQRSQVLHRFDDAVAQEMVAAQEYLRAWCARPKTEEALWSCQPGAADTLARYARYGSGNAWTRRLALRYLQRFATKNETASFFGPFQYGHAGGEGDLLSFEPDSPRLADRITRLSRFAVDELADLAAAQTHDDPTVGLRLHPLARLENGVLHAGGRRIALPAEFGAQPLHLGALSPRGQQVAAKLTAAGLLRPDLHPPSTSLRPVDDLARRLAAGTGDAARHWHTRVSEVDSQVAEIQQAPWPQRRALIEKLDSALAGWGVATTARPSGLYADRSVIFEEHRGGLRGLRMNLTAQLPAIETVLRVHAGHAAAVRQHIREWLDAQWAAWRLPPQVNLAVLAEKLGEQPLPAMQPPTSRMWDALAALAPADACEVQLSHEAVAEAFADVLPDEPFLCSPDFMVRGRVGLVLGEIHHGAQVWCWLAATLPRREREALGAQLAGFADVLRGNHRLATIVEPRRTGKTFTLELPGIAIERMGRSALPTIRQLHEVTAQRWRLADADGPLSLAPFSPVDPIVRAFGGLVLYGPREPYPALHRPRILVDGLVWWREAWTLTGEEVARLAGSRGADDAVRVIGRLRRDRGLPQYVFARVPGEPKPVFADLASAAYAELLSAMTRAALTSRSDRTDVTVELTEMLPAPAELALTCAEGTFTSELRTTVLVRPAGQP
ncbi:MAG TPA: hypothetical protein VFC19_12430 [Candidatus Limnocylindrales bacterium]|nr:hypothetical protein [Candidatus Limnocylindrales bacterium]